MRGLANNHVAFLDLVQEANEHRSLIEAPIVAETVLVQIGLQIVTANIVINALDSVLDQTPESFDGLSMGITSHIDFLAVANAPMVVIVRRSGEAVIRRIIIGKNQIGWQDVLFNQPMQRALSDIGCNECANAPLALDESDHGRFSFLVRRASAALHSLATAKVHFINLDGLLASAQLRRVLRFVQHGANLLEHAPRSFIGNARLALDLFCRNSATSRGHQIHRVEPRCKGRGRLVKDGASRGMNMVAAVFAAIRRSARCAVMLGHGLALLAVNAVRVEIVLEPFEASGIIGKLCLEGF